MVEYSQQPDLESDFYGDSRPSPPVQQDVQYDFLGQPTSPAPQNPPRFPVKDPPFTGSVDPEVPLGEPTLPFTPREGTPEPVFVHTLNDYKEYRNLSPQHQRTLQSKFDSLNPTDQNMFIDKLTPFITPPFTVFTQTAPYKNATPAMQKEMEQKFLIMDEVHQREYLTKFAPWYTEADTPTSTPLQHVTGWIGENIAKPVLTGLSQISDAYQRTAAPTEIRDPFQNVGIRQGTPPPSPAPTGQQEYDALGQPTSSAPTSAPSFPGKDNMVIRTGQRFLQSGLSGDPYGTALNQAPVNKDQMQGRPTRYWTPLNLGSPILGDPTRPDPHEPPLTFEQKQQDVQTTTKSLGKELAFTAEAVPYFLIPGAIEARMLAAGLKAHPYFIATTVGLVTEAYHKVAQALGVEESNLKNWNPFDAQNYNLLDAINLLAPATLTAFERGVVGFLNRNKNVVLETNKTADIANRDILDTLGQDVGGKVAKVPEAPPAPPSSSTITLTGEGTTKTAGRVTAETPPTATPPPEYPPTRAEHFASLPRDERSAIEFLARDRLTSYLSANGMSTKNISTLLGLNSTVVTTFSHFLAGLSPEARLAFQFPPPQRGVPTMRAIVQSIMEPLSTPPPTPPIPESIPPISPPSSTMDLTGNTTQTMTGKITPDIPPPATATPLLTDAEQASNRQLGKVSQSIEDVVQSPSELRKFYKDKLSNAFEDIFTQHPDLFTLEEKQAIDGYMNKLQSAKQLNPPAADSVYYGIRTISAAALMDFIGINRLFGINWLAALPAAMPVAMATDALIGKLATTTLGRAVLDKMMKGADGGFASETALLGSVYTALKATDSAVDEKGIEKALRKFGVETLAGSAVGASMKYAAGKAADWLLPQVPPPVVGAPSKFAIPPGTVYRKTREKYPVPPPLQKK